MAVSTFLLLCAYTCCIYAKARMPRFIKDSNIVLFALFFVAAAALAAGGVLRARDGLEGIFFAASASSPASPSTVPIGIYDPDEQFSRSSNIKFDEYLLD